GDALVDPGALLAREHRVETQRLTAGEVPGESMGLRQEADALARRAVARRRAEEARFSPPARHESHQHLDPRRLARAVRAEQAEDAAVSDLERDAVERAEALATSEDLDEVAHGDQGFARGHWRATLPDRSRSPRGEDLSSQEARGSDPARARAERGGEELHGGLAAAVGPFRESATDSRLEHV